ncbi:MAG TPA: HPr family phosphocarrier protein [Clostridiales bacterium]|nr:HPr family phosphocarrier protein [Clostridiales bacterium]
MITVKILINTVDKIKNFTGILAQEDFECDIVDGVNIIDGHSIMGIFSLDVSKPLKLNIHSDDTTILSKISEFIVED